MRITSGDIVSYNELNSMSEFDCRQMSASFGSEPDIDMMHDWYEICNGKDGINPIKFHADKCVKDPDFYLRNYGFYKRNNCDYALFEDFNIVGDDGNRRTFFEEMKRQRLIYDEYQSWMNVKFVIRRVIRDADRNWYMESKLYYLLTDYCKTVMDYVESCAKGSHAAVEVLFDTANWCDTGKADYISEPEKAFIDVLKKWGREDCIAEYDPNLVFDVNCIEGFHRHDIRKMQADGKHINIYNKIVEKGYAMRMSPFSTTPRIRGGVVAILENVQFADGLDLFTMFMRYGVITSDLTKYSIDDLDRSILVCTTEDNYVYIGHKDIFYRKSRVKVAQQFLTLLKENRERWGVRKLEYRE